MRFRYRAPLDPDCPDNPFNREPDPMDDYCGCMDEINEASERRHRAKCEQCKVYGAANIEVEGP